MKFLTFPLNKAFCPLENSTTVIQSVNRKKDTENFSSDFKI